MAFCANCGTELPEGVKFCPGCGKSTDSSDNTNQNTQPQNTSESTYTSEVLGQFAPDDIEKNKVLALFSYIGIFFLIPLLAAKDSPYARFHVNQGIVLFIVNIIYSIVSAVLNLVLAGSILGALVGALITLVGLVPFALMIVGIVNAVTGKAKELPVIGFIRILN